MKKLRALGIITVLMLVLIIIALAVFAALGLFGGAQNENPPEITPDSSEIEISKPEETKTAVIKTDSGDIIIELADCSAAEKFIELNNSGAFSAAEFKTLAENMFIQTNLCGEGFSFMETSLPCEKGAVGFVIEGEKAFPSIVIMTEDLSAEFEGGVLVFGKVVSGTEIVDSIASGENSGYTGGFSALEPVKINDIEIIIPEE